jgi:hypothetical protein
MIIVNTIIDKKNKIGLFFSLNLEFDFKIGID